MLPTSFRNALLICTGTLVLAGAAAAGDDKEWRSESRDGPCAVKVDAKHDEYKEAVECEEHDD